MRVLCIEHVTSYRFGRTVRLLPHRLMLRPRENHNLRITSSVLEVEPAHEVRWVRDALDNSIAVVTFRDTCDRLRIASKVVVEHYDDSPLDFLVEPRAVSFPFMYLPDEAELLVPFLAPSWADDAAPVEQLLRDLGVLGSAMETYSLLERLNLGIHQRFRSLVREEHGTWSPAETLANGSGACRDLAALFVDGCRRLGLASRFVSGYLHAPVSESGQGSTHAWAEVYLPGPGWKGFDPSTGQLTGHHHIAVAAAAHPGAVPPVAGSFEATPGIRPIMEVQVRVNRRPGS